VGTPNGLNRFVIHFTRFQHDPYDPHSLKDNRLLSLFQSRSGDIWIGTANSGIQRLFSHKKPFALYRDEPGNPAGLKGRSIHAIHEDKNDPNTLWIGTRGGGLNRFDRTRQTFEHYKNEPGNPYSLSHNEVKAVLRDSSGVLWVGTYGGGLNRFVENQKRFIYYMNDPQTPGSLSSNHISCLFEDSAHVLWIGTMTAGLNRFHKDSESFSCYRYEPGNPSGLSHYLICTICECKGNPDILWIGTEGGGLNRFNKTTDHFTHYRHKRQDPNSISSDIIMAFLQDRQGVLWIGTGGGGLNRFDPSTEQFTLFTAKDGLPNNTIYGIVEDHHGNLWLSTNRGLSKFNPAERTFRNYNVEDGLQSNEFNYGAAFKSKSGEIFFGGVNGFNAFYPDKIQDNPYIPPVVITDFKLFNKTVPIGKGPRGRIILAKSITETESITLSHRDYVISFEYAALNYESPEKNQYTYIMEGFEEEWNHVGTRRFATYTNLPPGEYTFRVKGSNNDSIWNQQGQTLRIFVRPPFWKTWWFAPLVFLLIISTALFFLQVKIRKDMAAKQHLEKEVARRTLELETIITENTKLLHQLQEANRHLVEARKEAEQEREAAENANLTKSQFLARMSHEIRTPMNGVIGFIEMLMDTKLSEEQADYVKSVHISGQVLLALIDDILDFSKIEAGQLSLDQVDFDPEVTAFDVCDLIRPRVGNKPVEVICHIDQHVPAHVTSDPGRFRQVLVNLMGNAAKFTETGEIQLSLEVEQEAGKELTLHTTVRDTGIGIPKDKLGSIFEIFQQADGSITRQFGGSGLGLAICKQISHLMEGDVWVESQEGKGSTFHFTARVKKSQGKPPPRRVHQSLTGKKILAIDDNRNNLKVLTLMLQQAGIRVTALTSGKTAAAMIREAAASGEPYHLCILDILMPDMDGYEVAKQVRQLTTPLCDIPLLAFSSSTLKRAKYFKEGGFDAFLPKPCQRQKILDMIERLLNRERVQNGTEKGDSIITQYTLSDEAKHSVNILLVEDNALNQKLARYMLTRAGYLLELAVNGKEAVEKFTAQPDRYDMIFMDVQMPEMNGLEATRAIREKGFKDVPIIAMTAQSLKGDREKCLEAGMNDYVSKPIKRESVFQMVQKWALNKSNR
jgi:signal transduction histidine kinase/DNA-binding response OmpR family regulator/streptogramin lyase